MARPLEWFWRPVQSAVSLVLGSAGPGQMAALGYWTRPDHRCPASGRCRRLVDLWKGAMGEVHTPSVGSSPRWRMMLAFRWYPAGIERSFRMWGRP